MQVANLQLGATAVSSASRHEVLPLLTLQAAK